MEEHIKQQLINYSKNYYCMSVSDAVPETMRAGPVDEYGWVTWKITPTELSVEQLLQLEAKFGVRFPAYFSAYLKSCCQLFDQVPTNSHDRQSLMLSSCPAGDPLGPLVELMQAWRPLIAAGYLPFAQWNDGWGPVCFDMQQPAAQGSDFPVVWFDHEALMPIGEAGCRVRSNIEALATPLYKSFEALFVDVFVDCRF